MADVAVVAVVIPCFRVTGQVLDVIRRMPAQVRHIIAVDDGCPEGSGKLIERSCQDPRVEVLFHAQNQGVGGAVVTGYQRALSLGADVVVKVDGDGQMAPEDIPALIRPLLQGAADYTKGNRFFSRDGLREMPLLRILGNAGLGYLCKMSSGYWSIMDPTNGFTAIHADVLRHLPLEKLARRFFFENDMLFRLSLARAVVRDVPMAAHYGGGRSNLSVLRALLGFPPRFAIRFIKRLAYRYFLLDFNVGSLQLMAGGILVTGGTWFGARAWIHGVEVQTFASAGTVMLAALPVMLGWQLLLAALSYDVMTEPRFPVHGLMPTVMPAPQQASAATPREAAQQPGPPVR